MEVHGVLSVVLLCRSRSAAAVSLTISSPRLRSWGQASHHDSRVLADADLCCLTRLHASKLLAIETGVLGWELCGATHCAILGEAASCGNMPGLWTVMDTINGRLCKFSRTTSSARKPPVTEGAARRPLLLSSQAQSSSHWRLDIDVEVDEVVLPLVGYGGRFQFIYMLLRHWAVGRARAYLQSRWRLARRGVSQQCSSAVLELVP